ncbi:transposase, partial [Shigella dysenteriae]
TLKSPSYTKSVSWQHYLPSSSCCNYCYNQAGLAISPGQPLVVFIYSSHDVAASA